MWIRRERSAVRSAFTGVMAFTGVRRGVIQIGPVLLILMLASSSAAQVRISTSYRQLPELVAAHAKAEAGSVKGFNAALVIYPEEDLIAVYSINADTDLPALGNLCVFADFFREVKEAESPDEPGE